MKLGRIPPEVGMKVDGTTSPFGLVIPLAYRGSVPSSFTWCMSLVPTADFRLLGKTFLVARNNFWSIHPGSEKRNFARAAGVHRQLECKEPALGAQ